MILVVFTQSPITSEPAECSFDNPTARQHVKSHKIVASPDNFQGPVAEIGKPINQLSSISSVGPDQLHSGKTSFGPFKQEFGSISILDIGRMNHNREHEPHRIDKKMSLAPLYFLASIVSARPPFSVVFTDWLSTIPALGSSCRPAVILTSRRRAS